MFYVFDYGKSQKRVSVCLGNRKSNHINIYMGKYKVRQDTIWLNNDVKKKFGILFSITFN